jgi:hypothetical protein
MSNMMTPMDLNFRHWKNDQKARSKKRGKDKKDNDKADE